MSDSKLLHAIESKLHRYLSGGISLKAFNRWLVASTWYVTPDSSRAVWDFSASVKCSVEDYDHGNITHNELFKVLWETLVKYRGNNHRAVLSVACHEQEQRQEEATA